MNENISLSYFLKSYGVGLFWLIVVLIGVNIAEAEDGQAIAMYFILSFVLFPLAKLVYDLLIGFRYPEQHRYFHTTAGPQLAKLILFIYLILLIFSIVLAPIGILYLMFHGVRYLFRKDA